VSSPSFVDPAKNSTFATPTLSVASTSNVTVPNTCAPSAGCRHTTVGACRSWLATVTCKVASVAFPAVSTARAFRVTRPSGYPVVFQLKV
jgi:hypothetical protein